MKYRVGQKVRIRKDLEVGEEYGGDIFDDNMERYKGKLAKVTDIYDDHYELDIDDNFWNWTDEMLEPAKKTLDNLEVGDVVVDKVGSEKMVLAICGKVYCLSSYDNFNVVDSWFTPEEIKKAFTLKNSEPEEDDKTEEAIELLKSKGYKIVKK